MSTSNSSKASGSSSGFLRVAKVIMKRTINKTIIIIPIINHSRGTTISVQVLLSAPAYSASPDQLALIEDIPAEEGRHVYEYRPSESVTTVASALNGEPLELTYKVTFLPNKTGEIEPPTVTVLPAIANPVETAKDKEEATRAS